MRGILSVLRESFRMKNPVFVVGIGAMGGVFARKFLRTGHPLYPLARETQTGEPAKQLAEPELVVIAVAEKDCQ